MNSTSKLLIALCIIGVICVVGTKFKTSNDQTPNSAWQSEYALGIEKAGIGAEYMESTQYFDYNDQIVAEVVSEIKSTAINLDDAIQKTLTYVYEHVEYKLDETDQACFSNSGSDTLVAGTGQCDTQSTAVISILRGLGIAARPVGGCVAKQEGCGLVQAVVAIKNTPIWQEVEIIQGKTVYSRGENAPIVGGRTPSIGSKAPVFASRSGGLHAWPEAFIPGYGWRTLEATAGAYADTQCFNYLVETYPQNDDRESVCVSKNMTFVNICNKI